MTDAEIIKGLRAVAKKYEGKPVATFETNISAMATDAANHIERLCDENNRQKAEIERLQGCVKSEEEVRAIMKAQMIPMVEEIVDEQFDIAAKLARAEAIKEFAERVKRYIDVGHLRPPTEKCFSELDVVSMIDNLVKEMVGDGDG